MLQLRLIVPPGQREPVDACLEASPAVTNVVRLPGAAVEPPGDLVLCDVAREAASPILEQLRGAGSDAVVWEEVESRTTEESRLSATYLAFMGEATAARCSWLSTSGASRQRAS